MTSLVELDAFQKLKERLKFPGLLALPQHGQSDTLDTEAYEYHIACALLQEQPNGNKLPAGYWSKIISAPEREYSSTELECLAVVWSIHKLRPFLYGDTFTLRADHHELKWILSLAEPSEQLARLGLRVAHYD